MSHASSLHIHHSEVYNDSVLFVCLFIYSQTLCLRELQGWAGRSPLSSEARPVGAAWAQQAGEATGSFSGLECDEMALPGFRLALDA